MEDLPAAYGLVHDAFVDKGYIHTHASGLRLRPFEALPEMATFVAVVDDAVAVVMAIVPDSPDLGCRVTVFSSRRSTD